MAYYDDVVIVDDDKVYANLMEKKIIRMDIASHVTCLENGKKALDYIRELEERSIDLMIVDINMPVMNGFDFLSTVEQIKSSTRLNAILVASNTISLEDKTRFMHLNCVSNVIEKSMVVDYLKKINQHDNDL